MNHSNHTNQSISIARRSRLKNRSLMLAVLMGLIAIAAGVSLCFRNSTQSGQLQSDYTKLIGDWQRPDGGYVIRISGIDPDGTVQAAYFNPNPIHVAKANVSSQNSGVTLFVELRDEGYPGCTYNILYNPGTDRLEGVYFQAQIQESYDVYFQRAKLK